MTQFQEILHYCFYNLVVFPRFFSIKRVICAVQTIHWWKDSKLYPPCSELVVSVSKHMSTDIMTPPSKTDVAGICCEIWLEFQTLPGNERITGKTNRVSVASWTCISWESQRTLSFPLAVQIVIVVQHPERIQSRNLGYSSLLPVKPPEVYSLFFHRMMQFLKICLNEFRICHIKKYRFLTCRSNSHLLCNSRIGFFISTHSICRMYVQCDLISMFVQPVHKFRRIWEKLLIPGISCPSASIYRRYILYQMPVHIYNCNRKRHFFFLKTLYQFFVLCLCVFVISAPPVSERISWKQRCFST